MVQWSIVKYEDCITPAYQRWMAEMGNSVVHVAGSPEVNNLHTPSRKAWEDVYILQALFERGMMEPGKRGLGFGCGKENMVSVFAKYGCDIVATDQKADNPKAIHDWLETGQLSQNKEDLFKSNVVDWETFDKHVTFENCDMNAIPDKYFGQFDFTWNACSMDHLGTLEKGLFFVEQSLRCLKPGGWAVHTTEYNVESNFATQEEGSTVFYRKRDIEAFAKKLEKKGYNVGTLDLSRGQHPENYNVDYEPHQRPSSHLVLGVCRNQWVVSSVIMVIQKPFGMLFHLLDTAPHE